MVTRRVTVASVAGALVLSAGAWAAFAGHRSAGEHAAASNHAGRTDEDRPSAHASSQPIAHPSSGHTAAVVTQQHAATPSRAATYVVAHMSRLVSSPPRSVGAATRGVVTPAFATEIQAMAADNHDLGVHVVGAPRVLWAKAIRSHDAPGTRSVEMCLDTSKVHILDASGHVAQQQRGVDRTRQIYTLARVAGRWLVASQSFPDDPSC